MWGTTSQNVAYIKKLPLPGDSEKLIKKKAWHHEVPGRHHLGKEYGKQPLDERGRIGALELKKMTVEEIIEADPRCAEAYIKSKVRLQNPSLIKFGTWKKDVEVIVFCRPSQAGKSQAAENCAEFYGGPKFNTEGFNEITHVGGFWSSDRLPDSPIVIYDEFRDSHMKPSEFIRFIDYRKHDMNIKTSWVRNTWNLILITTVQRPESWWSKMKRITKNPLFNG